MVRHQGKRTRTGSLEVRAIASLRAFARVGFVVPRYKRSAVDRNRLKRRLRELVRVELLPTLPPMDIVLRTLPHAYERDFAGLRDDVLRLVRQLPAQRDALTLPAPPTP